MHCRLLFLSSLLLLLVGCRHASSRNLPTLPASHGHLSLTLDLYLDERSKEPSFMPLSVFDTEAELVVEPAEAPAIHAEAVEVLKGQPSQEQVRQAAADLGAACRAGHSESCGFLRENYTRPQKRSGKVPNYPEEAFRRQTYAVVVATCRLGVDGTFKSCTVQEGAQYGITEAVLESIGTMNYAPVTLAGHPIEIPYTFTVAFSPRGLGGLLGEQRLQWARARAARFPHSAQAWANLAMELAKQAPEDPWYADALHYLVSLSPGHWWGANELAWLHVQAGRFQEAAQLAKRARDLEPGNSYVLETSAAVRVALGECPQGLLEQRLALAKLPPEWPAPERERFTRTLEDYKRRCPAPEPGPESP